MIDRRRLVWTEGLLLSPQHLQQWDRATQHLVAERFRAAEAFDWGLTRLDFDREALKNGRVSLRDVRGVLPDGTPFSCPEQDPLPTPRSLEGRFDARTDALVVHLGLPAESANRPALGAIATPGAAGPRYAADAIELPDDTTGQTARPVDVQRRNFQLLFPDEALGEHDAIPVAEVARTSEGGFALREAFIPPSLAIGASEALSRQLRAELEMLIAKSSELGDKRRQRGGVADFAATDSANFWLLHSVNAFIPALAHMVAHGKAHPEQAYLALAGLAGELCTFSPDLHPRDLPPYDHRALQTTFSGLHAALTRLLEITPRDKFVRIDLEVKGGGLHVGRIPDPRLVEPGASLFLGVRAEMEEARLVGDVPAKVKIASLDKIDQLITFALRGVPLLHQRVPPASLPIKSSHVYFQLDPNGDVWETVRMAKNVAIYVPPDMPGVQLELLGLRE